MAIRQTGPYDSYNVDLYFNNVLVYANLSFNGLGAGEIKVGFGTFGGTGNNAFRFDNATWAKA